jgi:hypothetical protein
MLLKEIIFIFSENNTKQINVLWAKRELLIIKAGGTQEFPLGFEGIKVKCRAALSNSLPPPPANSYSVFMTNFPTHS